MVVLIRIMMQLPLSGSWDAASIFSFFSPHAFRATMTDELLMVSLKTRPAIHAAVGVACQIWVPVKFVFSAIGSNG